MLLNLSVKERLCVGAVSSLPQALTANRIELLMLWKRHLVGYDKIVPTLNKGEDE